MVESLYYDILTDKVRMTTPIPAKAVKTLKMFVLHIHCQRVSKIWMLSCAIQLEKISLYTFWNETMDVSLVLFDLFQEIYLAKIQLHVISHEFQSTTANQTTDVASASQISIVFMAMKG